MVALNRWAIAAAVAGLLLPVLMLPPASGQGGRGRQEPAARPRPTTRRRNPTPPTHPTTHPTPHPSKPTNPAVIELAWIPPGRFMMGAENGRSDQLPMHQVTISEGFFMGKYEVTQAQWKAVMSTNPSHFDGDDLPAESMSWDDAVAFTAKLTAQNNKYTYRLPTEAEWEYAARAQTTGDFAGDLNAMGWYNKNSGQQTHPVGSKRPNGFELFDMHGGVWEWVQDWYHATYASAPTDGSAWLSDNQYGLRVFRGGAWLNDAFLCRSASRLGTKPSTNSYDIGFRVVAVARR